MTTEEYKIFKATYELMGELEQERKKKEPLSLKFLDEILSLTDPLINEYLFKLKLDNKIMVRKTLNQILPHAFDQI